MGWFLPWFRRITQQGVGLVRYARLIRCKLHPLRRLFFLRDQPSQRCGVIPVLPEMTTAIAPLTSPTTAVIPLNAVVTTAIAFTTSQPCKVINQACDVTNQAWVVTNQASFATWRSLSVSIQLKIGPGILEQASTLSKRTSSGGCALKRAGLSSAA